MLYYKRTDRGGSESAFSVGPSPQGLGPLSLSRNGSAARNRTERRPRSPPLQGSPRAAAASQPGNFQPRKRPPPRPAPGAQNAPDRFSPAVIFPPLLPSGGGPPGPPPPLAQKGTPPPPPAFYKLLRGEREKTPPYDSGHFFAVAAHGAPSLVPLLVKGLKAEMTSSPL